MIDDKIYKISVKRHNLNIMLDCTHYLISELLKLEETTIEEAKEFTKLFYEDGDLEKSLNHIITQKMWKLMTYFSYYYSYLLFSKKFVKQEKNKYILYLDNENILLKEQETGYIIKDKQFIKNLLEDDFMNNKLSSTINIRSFYENDRFVLLHSVRDYIIEYFKLDIKIDDENVAIIFKSDDIYTGKEKKEWELFKNTKENHKKLMKCINKF